MPAYVTLVTFTDQGIRNVKDSPQRAKAIAQATQAAGGRFIGIWWTQGAYDLVGIFEAPDDETAARLVLATSMQGHVRAMTMRAFSEEEMAHLVQGLP
jgi:uncharacterized protein with GYD domain